MMNGPFLQTPKFPKCQLVHSYKGVVDLGAAPKIPKSAFCWWETSGYKFFPVLL